MQINRRNLNLKITVIVTYVIMIAANAMANILPINGITTGEVSDSYPNLFAPAAITFAIWGLIYLLLLVYSLYQFGIFPREDMPHLEEPFKKIGIIFSLSSILNTIWIFTWHYRFIELSAILIIGVLVSLILINNITRKMKLSLKEYLLIRLPFSVYFGWITVATIANITTMLVKLGFSGFGISESIWTMIILIVGLIISALVIIRNKDLAYGLVIIWAYIGIYIKHVSPETWAAKYGTVIFTVVASIIMLVVVEIYALINIRRHDQRLRDI